MALPQPSSLLHLALEVRYRIYGFLFYSAQPILANRELSRWALTLRNNGGHNGVGHSFWAELSSQILRTCKQVAVEARFYL